MAEKLKGNSDGQISSEKESAPPNKIRRLSSEEKEANKFKQEDSENTDLGKGDCEKSIGLGDSLSDFDNFHEHEDFENNDSVVKNVLQIRGLSSEIQEVDLEVAFADFGHVTSIQRTGHFGFVAFSTDEEAEDCLSSMSASSWRVTSVLGEPAFVNYATEPLVEKMSELVENNVICLRISKVQYPITVQVLQTICEVSGPVDRIVISRRSGSSQVFAFVEFNSIACAKSAIENLDGAEIYSDCCLIAATFSRQPRLDVKSNDQVSDRVSFRSWDFTADTPAKPKVLLMAPKPGAPPQLVNGAPSEPPHSLLGVSPEQLQPAQQQHVTRLLPAPPHTVPHTVDPQPQQRPYNKSSFLLRNPDGDGSVGGDHIQFAVTSGQLFPTFSKCVVMIHGVADTVSCHRLFNILCLYSNVVRIKKLFKKENSALVQLADPTGLDRVLKLLNKTVIFGKEILILRSLKIDFLDAKGSFDTDVDYSNCRDNRYLPNRSDKNRPMAPTRFLQFFGLHKPTTEEQLMAFFLGLHAPAPVSVRLGKTNQKIGTVEFQTVQQATDALVIANHAEFKDSVSGEHLSRCVRLSFS